MAIRPVREDERAVELVGYVEREPDGTETYTVAPADAQGDDLMCRWITAPTALVEDLDEMR